MTAEFMGELSEAALGVAARGFWPAAMGIKRRLHSAPITISSPRSGEYLENGPSTDGPMTSFKVRGRLKFLPKGHEIWLVRQDSAARFWPQGFRGAQVVFIPERGEWYGRINGTAVADTSFRLFAVVTPPTTHEFFKFWQQVGDKTGHLEPIERIPQECVNFDYVQVSARPEARS